MLKQAGISVLVSAPEFKTSDYRAMVAEVRGECPDLREVLFLGDPEWEQLLATGRAADRELLARRETELSADDPINIQYTSGTTGFPKGATLTHHNLLNNGFFVGEGCGYTEADRICIPVPYYHCFGMGMGNLAATSHGATMVIPAPGLRPRADPAGRAGREVHVAVRRPDDVHRRAGAAELRRLRPLHPAHRDHGRLAVPGRGHEAGGHRDGHGRGDHLLRHDRDVTGLHPDRRRRRPRPPHLHRRPGAPAPGGQGRRPGHRADRAPRGDRRVLHPRLLGDARLLERAGEDRRGDRRAPAGCTPATSRSWTTRATSTSSAGSRTWSSAAARTSTRGRSRSSSTPTPTSSTRRSSASPTSGTARSSWPGSGCATGAEPLTAEALREFCAGKLAHYKVPRYVKIVDEFPMTVTGKIRKVEMRAGLGRGARPAGRGGGQERLRGRSWP